MSLLLHFSPSTSRMQYDPLPSQFRFLVPSQQHSQGCHAMPCRDVTCSDDSETKSVTQPQPTHPERPDTRFSKENPSLGDSLYLRDLRYSILSPADCGIFPTLDGSPIRALAKSAKSSLIKSQTGSRRRMTFSSTARRAGPGQIRERSCHLIRIL